MDRTELMRIERSGLRAWPAIETGAIEGWILRAARGYTQRANSAQPLGPVGDTDAAIAAVESWYRLRGLPPRFRLHPLCSPPDMDDRLEARGYRKEAEAHVQTAALGARNTLRSGNRPDPKSTMPALATEELLVEDPDEPWMQVYEEGSGRRDRPSFLTLLEHFPTPRAFASLRHEGETVACGLGIIDDGIVWLFDIATDPTRRRLGFGESLVKSLMVWGR
ncbi:MAG TPA: GNAT family N-acetyltransferase, partial [Fimbriimonadaceae bacterium]|nr:GNAT family N-acetyltransferase [Fimbriimonadaceae bacterium]